MAYWTHAKDSDPRTGLVWDTREAAHANKKPGEVITFTATSTEQYRWRDRERQRFDDGKYSEVPWACAPWYTDGIDGANSLSFTHYTHISLADKGLIAYTPNEESGCQDRQLRVRPGKYLAQFAPHLTKTVVDDYCAILKIQHDSRSTLQFARTPEEIVAAYRHPDRIICNQSCMSFAHKDWNRTPFNDYSPMQAYGAPYDLTLAYLGDLTKEVIARSVIWEAKKTYSRIYGDTSLRLLLEQEGYTQHWPNGAKVRAVEDGNGGWLMPYIDGIEECDLKRKRGNGSYFVLGSGSYTCKGTDGVAEEAERYTCANPDCGTEVENDGDMCSDCEDNRYYCQGCSDSFYDGNGTYINDNVYCEDCVSHCELCSDAFCNSAYPRSVRGNRSATDTTDICEDCRATHAHCSECNDYYATDDTADSADPDRCVDCQPIDDTTNDDATEVNS